MTETSSVQSLDEEKNHAVILSSLFAHSELVEEFPLRKLHEAISLFPLPTEILQSRSLS